MDKCLYIDKYGTIFQDGSQAGCVFCTVKHGKRYIGAFAYNGIRYCLEINDQEWTKFKTKGFWVSSIPSVNQT